MADGNHRRGLTTSIREEPYQADIIAKYGYAR
jgi:hypothetical protein